MINITATIEPATVTADGNYQIIEAQIITDELVTKTTEDGETVTLMSTAAAAAAAGADGTTTAEAEDGSIVHFMITDDGLEQMQGEGDDEMEESEEGGGVLEKTG